LRPEKAQRPLLADWPETEWSDRLSALLERRRPFYERAQVRCPVDRLFPRDADGLLRLIVQYG
jgi:hypothetical protein